MYFYKNRYFFSQTKNKIMGLFDQVEKNMNENLNKKVDETAENIKEEAKVYYQVETKGSNLNVRKGPGTDHEIAGKFPKGTKVLFIEKSEEDEGWFKVKNEEDELEGFVSAKYLKLFEE